MGLLGPWMGSVGLSIDFCFFILINRDGMETASANAWFTVTFDWRRFFARLLKFKTPASVNIFCSSVRPKPVKSATNDFEAQTIKPAQVVYSIVYTRSSPLDTCHRRPRPASPPSLPEPRSTRTSAVLT